MGCCAPYVLKFYSYEYFVYTYIYISLSLSFYLCVCKQTVHVLLAASDPAARNSWGITAQPLSNMVKLWWGVRRQFGKPIHAAPPPKKEETPAKGGQNEQANGSPLKTSAMHLRQLQLVWQQAGP